MDRVIKFRAFNKSEKKMCRVISTDFKDMVTVRFPEFEGEEYYDDYNDVMELDEFEPLLQFTGLTDRNGVDVYDKDIVECVTFDQADKSFKGEVFFDENRHGYSVRIIETNDKYPLYGMVTCEVIGNIYEHPHLLEGVK